MKYPLSQKYNKDFITESLMGPNAMKLAEELLLLSPIPENSVVLDLGCGAGLSSIFMAKEYNLRVFATDLWVSPTENKQRFDAMHLTAQEIIPIKAEAHDLPFAEEFFDAVLSVDAYHYFGCDKTYLETYLLPLVKHGGHILLSVPGLKKDIHGEVPAELLIAWSMEDFQTMHDTEYWLDMFKSCDGVEVISVSEMESFDECWNDWLDSGNEHAVNDRKAFNVGAAKYMNFIAMILRRK